MNARIETALRSATLPAGRYHLIFSSENMLVGSRSGVLAGLIPSGCVVDYAADDPFVTEATFPAFATTLYDDVDSVLPRPVNDEIQRIEYAGHTFAFIPNDEMGNNHSGWFEGFFLIPDAFFNSMRDDCASIDLNFDPHRAILDFATETTVTLNPDYDYEDATHVYPWIFFNDNALRFDATDFTGVVEMI